MLTLGFATLHNSKVDINNVRFTLKVYVFKLDHKKGNSFPLSPAALHQNMEKFVFS